MSGWGVGGRPKVVVRRRLEDYPPPTPQRTPCRLWQGAVDRDGYGIINRPPNRHGESSKRLRISRWVWEAANGPIPAGKVVRHRCDNRPCYRLSHLELGTVAENNNDARERGHLGRPSRMTEADIERLLAERAAGRTYRQIWEGWPEIRQKVAFTSLRTAVHRGSRGWTPDVGYVPSPRPNPPPRKRDAVIKPYTDWRDRDRPS